MPSTRARTHRQRAKADKVELAKPEPPKAEQTKPKWQSPKQQSRMASRGSKARSVETRADENRVRQREPTPAQIRARGGWLIQIGAFEAEDEAKQHLSEAQHKVHAMLAAADPFTERVQKGDKALYRARFAGFDKATAEAPASNSSAAISTA